MVLSSVALKFISMIFTLNKGSELVNSCVSRVKAAFHVLFGSRVYIFFDNYSSPFPAHSVLSSSVFSATPSVMYNADTRCFYLDDTTGISKRLPILSLEIIDSDSEVVFDLTDYVETVRYYGNSLPTISELVVAWSLGSWIVLDTTKYKARYITQTCDTVTVSISDKQSLQETHED